MQLFSKCFLAMQCQALGVALGGIPWGWLIDRAGRRLPVQLAYTLVVLLGIGTAFSPSYEWFLASRFAFGLALACAPQMYDFTVVALVLLRIQVQYSDYICLTA